MIGWSQLGDHRSPYHAQIIYVNINDIIILIIIYLIVNGKYIDVEERWKHDLQKQTLMGSAGLDCAFLHCQRRTPGRDTVG